MSDSPRILAGMRRSRIIVEVADLVLKHPDDLNRLRDAVYAKFPPGDDRMQASVTAECLLFMLDELGRAQVEQVRGTHWSKLVAEGAA